MINELTIKGLKCFEEAEFHFKNLTLLAGKNSMGKSTVIQALLAMIQKGKNPFRGEYIDIGKISELKNKYVGSKEELRMLLKEFEDFISCPITKSIRKLESKMVERDEFITNSKYTFDELITPTDGGKPYLSKGTSSQLDKMIRESGDLYDQIRKLRDQLKSNQSGTSKGGQEKSLIDGR